jgi:hypothetical protein
MTFDLTAADKILKRTYPNEVIEIDYARAKTLALLQKGKGTIKHTPFGSGFEKPLKYGNPQAGSADYATGYAQAATEKSRYQGWLLTPAELFQFARVSGKVLRRSEGAGSFVNAMVSEIENARQALTRIVEICLGGDGWGCIGQIDQTANSVSTTTVILAQPWMARFFEEGMALVASASLKADALRGTPTPIKVTKIGADRITVAAAGYATSSWAVGDYLFRHGDRENLGSSTATRQVPCGFGAFIPDTDPTTGQLLFTVDQSLSPRTGGIRRAAATSGTIEEALLDLSSDIDAQSGVTTHCVMGTKTHAKLVKSMLNKTYFDVEDIDEKPLGFRGVLLAGASGDMLCYSDGAFPEGKAWQFGLKDVGILHTGADMITLEKGVDGLTFREIAGTDDWMARLISSWQFYCDAPGHAGIITGL